MLKHFIVTAVFALTTYTYANDSRLKLERVNVYKSENDCKTTEIVSIQEKTNRLALSCSDKGTVDILSIELPFKPTLLHSITISTQEEISSIAFHQSENIVAAAVLNNNPFEKGRIQIHRADNGEIINTLEAGIHPDGLAFSPKRGIFGCSK